MFPMPRALKNGAKPADYRDDCCRRIGDDDGDTAPGVVLPTCCVARLIALPHRALRQEKYDEQEQRKGLLRRSKRGQPAWHSVLPFSNSHTS